MSLEPRMILTGQDDVARRKLAKKILSDRVEASMDEFGLFGKVGNFLKDTVKKVIGKDDKKDSSKSSEDDSKSTKFNEKEHPRGPDGQFVEAPEGSKKGGGLIDLEPLRNAREIEAKKDELYQAELKQWESDKKSWDVAETLSANKKIKAINDKDMKKAQSDLTKARNYLKREDLSDEDFTNGTKKLQRANEKIKEIKTKISKITPKSYKVTKPKRAKTYEPPAPAPSKKKPGLLERLL